MSAPCRKLRSIKAAVPWSVSRVLVFCFALGAVKCCHALSFALDPANVGIVTDSGSYPTSLEAADLNSDGYNDIAAGELDANTAYILINNGGQLTAFTPVTLTVDAGGGTEPIAVTIADFNLDGQTDIGFGLPYRSEIVFYGTGNTAFLSLPTTLSEISSLAVGVSLENGFPKSSLFVAGDSTITYYTLNGSGVYDQFVLDGNFTSVQKIAAAYLSSYVSIDIVGLSNEVPLGSLRVYKNDGAGNYVSETISDTLSSPSDFVVADLDGTGDLEIVVSCDDLDAGNNLMYFTYGGASWSMVEIDADIVGIAALSAGDMDQDGDVDIIVVVDSNVPTLHYYENTRENGGGVAFTTWNVTVNVPSVQTISMVDLNADGILDVLLGTVSGIYWLQGWIGAVPTQTVTPAPVYTAAPTDGSTPIPPIPTPAPTFAVTLAPTFEATVQPTATLPPTHAATIPPTFAVTPAPTFAVTLAPTFEATSSSTATSPPTATSVPTVALTQAPTLAATFSLPTFAPTYSTEVPTPAPSEVTTPSPTDIYTPSPSILPTFSPTDSPTPSPSEAPTPSPSEAPTVAPSEPPCAATNDTCIATIALPCCVNGDICALNSNAGNYTCQLPTLPPTPAPTQPPTTQAPTPAPTQAPTTPAPTQEPGYISLARFADSGDYIDVTLAGVPISTSLYSNCASMFTAASLAYLGANYRCQGVDATHMRVYVGGNPSLHPITAYNSSCADGDGASLTLVVGSLSCGTVYVPLYPANPYVVLVSAAVLAPCQDAVLDAADSQSGNTYPLNLAWSCLGNCTASVSAIINQTVNSTVTIPEALLEPEVTYVIQLVLSTVLGQSSNVTHTFTVGSDASAPLLAVVGPSSIATSRSRALMLQVSASQSPCALYATDLSTLAFVWELVQYVGAAAGNTPALALTSSLIGTTQTENPRILFIPAYTLGYPGSTYVFKVSMKSKDGQLITTTAINVLVTKSTDDLLVAVVGGSTVTISSSNLLTLDAVSATRDVSGIPGLPITFAWTCMSVSGTSCTYTALSNTVGGIITIGANKLSPGSSYTIGLTACKGLAGASPGAWNELVCASTTVSVVVTSSPVPRVQITTQDSLRNLRKFNPSVRLELLGSSDTLNVAYDWQVTNATAVVVGGSDTEWALLFRTARSKPTLVVAPQALNPGTTYTFTLSATTLGGGATGKASFIVVMNSPPSGGSVSTSSATVEAAVGQVILTASAWTDELEDLPLSYAFSYLQGVSSIMSADQPDGLLSLSAGAFSPQRTWAGPLPLGSASYDNKLTMVVRVSDSLGAVCYSSLDLNGIPVLVRSVTPTVVPADFLSTSVSGKSAESQMSFLQAAMSVGVDFGTAANSAVVLSTIDNSLDALNYSEDLGNMVANVLLGVVATSTDSSAVDRSSTIVASLITNSIGTSSAMGTTLATSLLQVMGSVVSSTQSSTTSSQAPVSSTVNTTLQQLGKAVLTGSSVGEKPVVIGGGAPDTMTLACQKQEATSIPPLTAGSATLEFAGSPLDSSRGAEAVTAVIVDLGTNSARKRHRSRHLSAADTNLNAGQVASVNLFDSNDNYITNLSAWSIVTVPVPTAGTDLSLVDCSFYNETAAAWSSNGLLVGGVKKCSAGSGYCAECYTPHFTSFSTQSVNGSSVSPVISTSGAVKDSTLIAMYNTAGGYILVAVVLVLAFYLVHTVFFCYRDSKYDKQQHIMHRLRSEYLKAGRIRPREVPIYLSLENPASDSQTSRRHYSQSGRSADVSTVEETDEEDGKIIVESFDGENNKALDELTDSWEAQTEHSKKKAQFANSRWQSATDLLANTFKGTSMSLACRSIRSAFTKHHWNELYGRRRCGELLITRSERSLVQLCGVLAGMAIQAAFYGKNQYGMQNYLLMVLVSVFCMIPITFIFQHLFMLTNTPPASATLVNEQMKKEMYRQSLIEKKGGAPAGTVRSSMVSPEQQETPADSAPGSPAQPPSDGSEGSAPSSPSQKRINMAGVTSPSEVVVHDDLEISAVDDMHTPLPVPGAAQRRQTAGGGVDTSTAAAQPHIRRSAQTDVPGNSSMQPSQVAAVAVSKVQRGSVGGIRRTSATPEARRGSARNASPQRGSMGGVKRTSAANSPRKFAWDTGQGDVGSGGGGAGQNNAFKKGYGVALPPIVSGRKLAVVPSGVVLSAEESRKLAVAERKKLATVITDLWLQATSLQQLVFRLLCADTLCSLAIVISFAVSSKTSLAGSLIIVFSVLTFLLNVYGMYAVQFFVQRAPQHFMPFKAVLSILIVLCSAFIWVSSSMYCILFIVAGFASLANLCLLKTAVTLHKRISYLTQKQLSLRWSKHTKKQTACAITIQCAFRVKLARVVVIRAAEYDAWIRSKREKTQSRIIVSFIVCILILFLVYVNLVFGLNYDKNTRTGWLTTCLAAILIETFVQQPILLMFGAVFEDVDRSSMF